MPSKPSIRFRSATASDVAFLRALRLATMRDAVLRHRSWDDEEQERRVLEHFEFARIIIAERENIGLLKVVRKPDYIHLLQIQLVPSFQGLGIGSKVIQNLQDECAAAELPLVLGVYMSNRAVGLYTRLGFEIVEHRQHSYTMRWQKKKAQPNQKPESKIGVTSTDGASGTQPDTALHV